MKFVTMRLTEKTNKLSKQVAKRTGMHQYAVLERAMLEFAGQRSVWVDIRDVPNPDKAKS